jgi:hypothetical protein
MIRANYRSGNLFVIVENDTTRVTAEGTAPFFEQVSVWSKTTDRHQWAEEITWDEAEWREKGNEAFEAILGAIAKVAAGKAVRAP